ncbi:MAG: NAD(P)-binding domain-containing protein [Lactobacillaceae bacterium]|jgi:pyrroline-5-carboxylate reductase|nr:NAD(P)-binding domain-containing protein [Lactobacillaceae bacterium]
MKIGFIGAGNMAQAMILGWRDHHEISIFSPNTGLEAAAELKVEFKPTEELATWADLVVVATPVDALEEVAPYLQQAKVVVSVLGGISLKTLRSLIENAGLVRALPNVNVSKKVGFTALAFEKDFAQVDTYLDLFNQLGTAEIIDEDKFAAVSAVAGSGPAFVAGIIQSYAFSAERVGLDGTTALKLSLQTFIGTLFQMPVDADLQSVADAVMTPGGSTEQGFKSLKNSDINDVFQQMLQATIDKNNSAE